MLGLLYVVRLDIWNCPNVTDVPNVPRVLTEWVAALIPFSGAFVMSLSGVKLWSADRVQVEIVVVAFRIP